MLAMPEAILKGLLFEGKDFMQVFLHWTVSVSQLEPSFFVKKKKKDLLLPQWLNCEGYITI